MNKPFYTDLLGKIVQVDVLDWLEDETYWMPDNQDEDNDDDFNDAGNYLHCSRYCIGVDENGDGLSVWLNDDMQEVEV